MSYPEDKLVNFVSPFFFKLLIPRARKLPAGLWYLKKWLNVSILSYGSCVVLSVAPALGHAMGLMVTSKKQLCYENWSE